MPASLPGCVRVADIMTPELEIATEWEIVAGFAGRVAARTGQEAFAVVDPGAELIGVALVSALARISAARSFS